MDGHQEIGPGGHCSDGLDVAEAEVGNGAEALGDLQRREIRALLRGRAQQEVPAFTPLEVAESLSAIANLGLGDIESVTAVPSGASFLVTVHLKDGSDLPFIMSKDGDTGALSLASTE